MSTNWIVIGLNERSFLGEGWYGLEKSPEGLLYRAATRKATIHSPLSGQVNMILLLSARPEHSGAPLRVTVSAGNTSRFSFELTTNHWTTRGGEFFLDENCPITIETHNPWSPDSLYGNADLRALGILLSAARITNL